MPELSPADPATLALLTPAALPALTVGSADSYSRLVVRGGGDADARKLLVQLSPDSLLARPARRSDSASAVLSGLWLWHDWLDESHTLSQAIHSPTGSYWHGIMHRREGDFGNAKYWFAKCRSHPAHSRVAELARPVLDASPVGGTYAGKLTRGGWEPYALVDLAQEADDRPAGDPVRELAVALQRAEWKALFAETVQEAVD
jgi:hypothetical protein